MSLKKLILVLIILAIQKFSYSQSFTISANPDTVVMLNGDTTSINISATVYGGFSASIFLSIESFTTADIKFHPAALNQPYLGRAIISSYNLPAGINRLIIKGINGNLISLDTVIVRVIIDPNQKWFHFKKENSGLQCNFIQHVSGDKADFIRLVYNNCDTSGIQLYKQLTWENWYPYSKSSTDFFGNLLSTESDSLYINSSGGIFNSIATATDSLSNVWIANNSDGGVIKKDSDLVYRFYEGSSFNTLSCFNNKTLAGAWSKGIFFFDGDNWSIFNSGNSFLPSDFIRDAKLENDSTLWVGTTNGLARFDKHYWTIYNSNNSILEQNDIHNVQIDNLKRIWILADDNLGAFIYKYEAGNWQMINAPLGMNIIFIDRQNNLWSASHYTNRIHKFNGTTWTEFNSTNSGFCKNVSSPILVNSFYQDYKNTLWIGTSEGLFAFNPVGLRGSIPFQIFDTLQTTTSVKKENLKASLIYPNPSNGIFHFSNSLSKNYPVKITVINNAGVIVRDAEYSQIPETLNYEDLIPGFYIIKISGNIDLTSKLIISH